MTPEEREQKLLEAKSFMAQGNNDEATRLVREVLDHKIHDPDALQLLGQISHEDGNFDIARDLYKESLKLDEDQAHVWNHLGHVLNDLRQPEEAEKALQKALDLNPNLGRAYKNLADIRLNRGDREEGLELCRKALEVNPDLVGIYLTMAKAKGFGLGDPEVKEMEKGLKKFAPKTQGAGMLHFAFAYLYQRAEDADKFFFHLNKANKAFHDPENEWRKKLALRNKNIKEVMTPEFLAKKVGPERKINTPIFIVGMPRSGTSLTDQIFATHSMCFGGGELQYFTKYLNRVCQAVLNSHAVPEYPKLSMEHLAQVATLYQQRIQLLSPGTQYISDKMPWNYQMIGMIHKILPWAKIIHIYRDPLDCGFSCYRNPLPKNLQFTCGMEDYAYYRSKYQEIMDFWQETLPDAFINLCYEEMVDNPKKELKRVLDYCGLPWEDGLLDFHKTKRQVRTISSDQVNKPLNKGSIGIARKKYAKQLAPMIEALEGYGLI